MVMRFSNFLDSSPKYTRLLIAPDGLKSNVFGLDTEQKLHRSTIALDVAQNNADNYAFAPWLNQEEQIFYKIKEQFGKISDSWLTVAFPAGVCRFIPMTFHLNRSRPSDKIDEREIQNEVYQILQNARENLRKELLREGGGSFVLVDAIMADFKIDGYSVYNPVGLKGATIEARLLAIFSFAEAVNFAQKLAKKLEVNYLHQTAFAALVAPTISPMLRTDRVGCGIFLRNDATDILLFNSGALSSVFTISVGRDIFTHLLAEAFVLPAQEAERVLVADAQGVLSRSMNTRIRKILTPAMRHWLSALELIFNERIYKNNLMPSRMVLSGSVPYPKDIMVNFGLYSQEIKNSRAVIQPDNLFSSIATKELAEYNLSNLIYPWIVNKVKPQKAIIGPALTLKVFPVAHPLKS